MELDTNTNDYSSVNIKVINVSIYCLPEFVLQNSHNNIIELTVEEKKRLFYKNRISQINNRCRSSHLVKIDY